MHRESFVTQQISSSGNGLQKKGRRSTAA